MFEKTWLESQGRFENKDKMPPRLTIAYSYFEEPELLEKQISLWEDYPPGVEIFITDDYSVKYPAHDILKDVYFPYGVDIQLWRVTRDLGFNSHGCRNLAAKYAPTDVIAFLDIDMTLNPGDVGQLRRITYSKGRTYFFNMYSYAKKQFFQFPGHLNTFIVHRDTYWEAGGYDESFTGYHTGDREFHQRLEQVSTKNNVGITLGLHRGGRKAVVDEGVEGILEYDNENMLIKYSKPVPDLEQLKGTVSNKINFPFVRLL